MTSSSRDDTGSPPTPPAPSNQTSGSWQNIDTSGCLPTPTQRSPVVHKLRGALWATRYRGPRSPARRKQEPLFRRDSTSPPSIDKLDPPLPSRELSVTNDLAELLFPALELDPKRLHGQSQTNSPLPPIPSFDINFIAAYPQSRVPSPSISDNYNHNEEVDELKTPSPSPEERQEAVDNDNVASVVRDASRSKRSIPNSRSSRQNVNVKGMVRSQHWRVFKEQVGMDRTREEPAVPGSDSSQLSDTSQNDVEQHKHQAYSPPMTGPACHTRSSMKDRRDRSLSDVFAESRFFDDNNSPKPLTRTRGNVKKRRTAFQAEDDIPVPPLHYFEELQNEHDTFQQAEEVDPEADVPNARPHLDHRSRKTGKTFVYEAVIPNPRYDLDNPIAGHRALQFGYIVPDPRLDQQKTRCNEQPRKQVRRNRTSVLGRIEQTSFKPMKRSHTDAELDDDYNSEQALSLPPSPHTNRKPLGELRATHYVKNIADELAYSPGRDADGERSSPLVAKAKRAKKAVVKAQRLKGYSALAIGPVSPSHGASSPVRQDATDNNITRPAPVSRIEQSKKNRKDARNARMKKDINCSRLELAIKAVPAVQASHNRSSLLAQKAVTPQHIDTSHPELQSLAENLFIPQGSTAQRHSHTAPAFQPRTRPQRQLSTLASTQTALRKAEIGQSQVSAAGKPFRRAMDIIDPYHFRLPENRPRSETTDSESVRILAGPSRTYTLESRRDMVSTGTEDRPSRGLRAETVNTDSSSVSGPRILANPSRTYTVESMQRTTSSKTVSFATVNNIDALGKHCRSVTDDSMQTAGGDEVYRILAGPSRSYTVSNRFSSEALSLEDDLSEAAGPFRPIHHIRNEVAAANEMTVTAEVAQNMVSTARNDNSHDPLQEQLPVDNRMAGSSHDSHSPVPSATPPPPAQQPPAHSYTESSHVEYWDSDLVVQGSCYDNLALSRRGSHANMQYQPRTPSPIDDSPPVSASPETLVTLASKAAGAYGRQHNILPQMQREQNDSGSQIKEHQAGQRKRRHIQQDRPEGGIIAEGQSKR